MFGLFRRRRGEGGGDAGFRRQSPEEEVQAYATRELERLRASDADHDEALYREALDLVLQRLRGPGKGEDAHGDREARP